MLGASTPELRNMEYTNIQNMSKMFQFLQKKLGSASKRLNFLDANIQHKCADVENVHVLVDESRHPSWAKLFDEFGDLQEHNITQKLVIEHSEEILTAKWLEYSTPSWMR